METIHGKDSNPQRTGKFKFLFWIMALKIWVLIGLWFLKSKIKLI
jgi:hypothetical protein